jgi:tryptophan 7-halogenase
MRHIVIAGGGTAGWMTAAAFARFLGDDYAITLVESEAIGTVGVGEATIPQIRLFNAGLGIDEAEFVAVTQGSFKLGIEFDGWRGPNHKYIHAFGSLGRPLGLIGYHHYFLRGVQSGHNADLWAASPCAQAAALNRFAPIADEPGHAPAGVAYAFQFDAGLYAAFLRKYAEGYGVTRIEGEILAVHRDDDSGDIASLKLNDDRSIDGDFFIDCTGFQGLLIEGALASGFEDWSHWLPCNRAIAVPSTRIDPLPPYTRAMARPAGWQWRIPLQHRTGNGHVFCADYMSSDEATAILLDGIEGEALAEPRELRFTAGKRKQHWIGNTVAIGLSGGFMEPLESTSIHLIQSAIARLLQMLPKDKAPNPAAIAEYNRQTDFEWRSIRDFLILHYHINGRDEPFWQSMRDMDIPDSLSAKIALFRESGGLFREHEELFTPDGWMQVLWGQGIQPDSYHPLADQLSASDLSDFLKITSQHADNVVAAMPDHAAFIAAHCSAQPIGVSL